MNRLVIVAVLLARMSGGAAAASLDSVHHAVTHRALAALNNDATSTKKETPTMLMTSDEKQPQQQQRQLEEIPMNCDGAFLGCMGNEVCSTCFKQIHEYDIDWASVVADTPCDEVVSFLREEDICKDLKGNPKATTAFCLTFHTCAFWTQGEEEKKKKEEEDKKQEENEIDCSTLTECKWEGMHENFIGDGICHDVLNGCYNTAVCKWDGGDCCEDTCKTDKDSYIGCGHDGYACRDPNSKNCNKALSLDCKKQSDDDDDGSNPDPPSCGDGQVVYRLVMYDSFGDGWDGTILNITPKNKPDTSVFSGTLEDGKKGIQHVCLSEEAACYHVDVTGGTWGKEVSWDIRGFSEGAQAIASGSAPMSCDFPIGGSNCDNTCFGKPTEDPTKDPNYRKYKDMFTCISKSCVIQVGACQKEKDCMDCLGEDVPERCHSIPSFNAVIDCSLCQCTDKKGSDFCVDKLHPEDKSDPSPSNAKEECTPGEIMKGGAAVMEFSQCTDFDSVSMMVTDFDQNNFGDLDKFEACGHAFAGKADKGGKTALECLQILVNAKNGELDRPVKKNEVSAVAALANLVYNDSENFCDCAKRSSESCPLCPSFIHFKTLLYESLDACKALDEIDCAAWEEFADPCEKNLLNTYSDIDFTKNKEQCGYVRNGCGGVGPFPAFRKLDCYKEIDSVAWDFHNVYVGACGNDDGGGSSPSTPVTPPTPYNPQPAPAPAPTPIRTKPPVAPKPYVPPEDRGKKDKNKGKDKNDDNDNNDDSGGDGKKEYHSDDDDDKKSSHRFRNFVLFCLFGGGGYYLYKNRSDGFDFTRYRRMQRNFGEEDMYSGLAMESSTNFQPPSLPPPPTAMMGGSGQYGQY